MDHCIEHRVLSRHIDLHNITYHKHKHNMCIRTKKIHKNKISMHMVYVQPIKCDAKFRQDDKLVLFIVLLSYCILKLYLLTFVFLLQQIN